MVGSETGKEVVEEVGALEFAAASAKSGKDVAESLRSVGVSKPVGDGVDTKEIPAKFVDVETGIGESGLVFAQGVCGERLQLEGNGEQELLGGRKVVRGEALQDALIPDAFAGGAEVEDNESVRGLEEEKAVGEASGEPPVEAEGGGGRGGV